MRATLPDFLRDRFEVLRAPRTAAIVRVDFRDAFDRHALIRSAGGSPLPAARTFQRVGSGGRGAALVLPAGPLGEVVLRPFRRGGWVQFVVRTAYLRGDRAFDELILTERLRRAGAPVPEALAAVQKSIGPGPAYRASLVTRRASGFVAAPDALRRARPGEAAGLMAGIGGAIRRAHEAGGWHADLNAWNLLLPAARPGLAPILIDWDRGRWHPGGVRGRAARANLDRLHRSLRKLGLEAALGAWDELEAAYGSAPAPEPAA